MVPTEFALKIKAFVEYNGIDWRNTNTEDIVAGYIKAQNDEIELAASQSQAAVKSELPTPN